jgi:hypothetical protein
MLGSADSAEAHTRVGLKTPFVSSAGRSLIMTMSRIWPFVDAGLRA